MVFGQQAAQSWFLEESIGRSVRYEIPFIIRDISVNQTSESTRFVLSLSNLRQPVGIPENSVFILEIHTRDLVIVYTHNGAFVPGVRKDHELSVIKRKGATLLAVGEIQFDWDRSQIVVSVPSSVVIDGLWGAVYRYLPSVADLERVAGGLPPSVDHVTIDDNPFGKRYPGWPRPSGSHNLQQQQQQRRLQNRGGQQRRQPGGQQRVSGGGVQPPQGS